jgi:hypothetical protein
MNLKTGASPEPQAPLSSHTIFKLVAAFIVLLVVAAVVAVLPTHYRGGSNHYKIGQSITYGPAPKGLLIMTVARNSTNGEQVLPAIYDLSAKKLSYPPVAIVPGSTDLAMQHSFSSNGEYATFVGADNGGNTASTYVPTQVYRADLSASGSKIDFIGELQKAKSVTSGSGVVRLGPSISDNNEVVYFAHLDADTSALAAAPANEWNIHLVSSSGSDRVVASGVYPRWVGNNQFVYIKNDGLYLYSIVAGSEKKIWGSKGIATMTMHLDVSKNYQYLAWTAPKAKEVFVYEASNWAAGEIQLKGIVNLIATGVAFSPDNNRLVVQSPFSTGSPTGGVVESFFDLDTMKLAAPPYAIRNVNQDLTFLTDWIL